MACKQRVHQGLLVSFDVAEFLLHDTFSRPADPADPGPNPRRRDFVGYIWKYLKSMS